MMDCIVTPFAVVLAGAGLRVQRAAGRFKGTPFVAGFPAASLRSY